MNPCEDARTLVLSSILSFCRNNTRSFLLSTVMCCAVITKKPPAIHRPWTWNVKKKTSRHFTTGMSANIPSIWMLRATNKQRWTFEALAIISNNIPQTPQTLELLPQSLTLSVGKPGHRLTNWHFHSFLVGGFNLTLHFPHWHPGRAWARHPRHTTITYYNYIKTSGVRGWKSFLQLSWQISSCCSLPPDLISLLRRCLWIGKKRR